VKASTGVLLLAVACAHGPSTPARAHAPIYLASVEGLSDDQNRMLEGTICQGLTEGNGSDVSCPEGIRAALALRAQRTLMTGQPVTDGVDPLAEAQQIDQVVTFTGEAADGGFTGHLVLKSKSAGKDLAHRDYHVATWDELMVQAQPEAKALVQ
jgi:hypothetical protein